MTRYRLVYTDNNGDLQVLGNLDGTDGRALKRAQWRLRYQETDRMSIWADVDLGPDIPLDNTQFGTAENSQDEPVFRWQKYDGNTWDTLFRGYNDDGVLLKNKRLKLRLWGMSRYIGRQELTSGNTNFPLSSTTNIDVMKEALPAGYVLDHPTETEVQNNSDQSGFVDLDRYALFGQRKRVFYDMTTPLGWVLIFRGSTNNNGDIPVRYEPVGYGGTVDDLRGPGDFDATASQSLARFKEWNKKNRKRIVNSVEVINTNTAEDKVIGSHSDSTSISEHGERYLPLQVNFAESDANADDLAKRFVDERKDPQSGGVVHVVGRYDTDVVNDSFDVLDTDRNIDGVYYVTEQVEYYPEDATDLRMTFEQEQEGPAALQENLRSERNKVYPSSSKSVGGQTGSAAPGVGGKSGNTEPGVGGQTGETEPGVGGDTGNAEPGVSGTTDTDGGATVVQSTSDSSSGENINSGDGWQAISNAEVDAGTGESSGADFHYAIQVSVDADPSFFSTTGVNLDVRVTDEFDNKYPDSSGIRHKTRHDALDVDDDGDPDRYTLQAINGVIRVPEDTDLREYQLELNTNQDITAGIDVHLTVYDTHDHAASTGDGTMGADNHPHSASNNGGTLDTDNHPHQDGTLDTDNHPHGDGTYDTDSHPHSQGTLEADVSQEDKNDR